MTIRGTIQYRGLSAHMADGPGPFKTEFERSIKQTMIELGEHWREKFLPRHFTTEAYHEYRYSPRTKEYMQKKMRHFGHNLPLVLTGQSRREILRSNRDPVIRRKAGVLGVEVKFSAPSHFFKYSKKGKIVNKVDELTRVSKREISTLAKMMDRNMEQRLQSMRETRVRRSS